MPEDEDFIGDSTEIENSNRFAYYGLTNSTWNLLSAEEDVFSQSDVYAFLNGNVEARNVLPPNYFYIEYDSEVDKFENSKNRTDNFKNTLLIPHGKDDKVSFFYLICYSIHYLRTKKLSKCDDDGLVKDMPETLLQKLSPLREELVLDLRFQSFKNQCFLVNEILMSEKKLFRMRNKFRNIAYTNSERNKITRDLSSFIAEKF